MSDIKRYGREPGDTKPCEDCGGKGTRPQIVGLGIEINGKDQHHTVLVKCPTCLGSGRLATAQQAKLDEIKSRPLHKISPADKKWMQDLIDSQQDKLDEIRELISPGVVTKDNAEAVGYNVVRCSDIEAILDREDRMIE